MRSAACFLVLVLSVPVALAQRGGGFGHGGGVASRGAVVARPGFGRYGREHGFRYRPGYIWPYYPIWDYSSTTPLYYEDEFPNEYPEQYPPAYELQAPPAMDSRAQAPRIATSVIHDYNFPKQTTGTPGKAEFTIVLKDGSTRSAVASWVTGGQLHYIAPDSRQEVLAAALIDRKATEEANEAKNLNLVLPPG